MLEKNNDVDGPAHDYMLPKFIHLIGSIANEQPTNT